MSNIGVGYQSPNEPIKRQLIDICPQIIVIMQCNNEPIKRQLIDICPQIIVITQCNNEQMFPFTYMRHEV